MLHRRPGGGAAAPTLENAISRFKAHAAEAIGELTARETAYKSNITDYEERWESTRRATYLNFGFFA